MTPDDLLFYDYTATTARLSPENAASLCPGSVSSRVPTVLCPGSVSCTYIPTLQQCRERRVLHLKLSPSTTLAAFILVISFWLLNIRVI
ncbi:hypothetical protein ACOMHN_038138 [Nucella lapillus]